MALNEDVLDISDPLLCEHWSIILENPYEGVLFVDDKGIIRYVSKAFAKYNNARRRDFLGHHFSEFSLDDELARVLETRDYLMLQHHAINKRNFIASRYPVYRKDQEFAGVFARYFSINSKDAKSKYGDEFIEVMGKLQVSEIMRELQRSTMELNSYKDYFNEENLPSDGIGNIVGKSPFMEQLKKNILQISKSPSSVLITGESGTGKELVAKAIHFHGDRTTKPFIKVNCTAIPDTLVESELFGYSDGAFTGARKGGKMGKFELANKGTIFLDEIGDMPLSMQAKILRVLQEREIERIGSEKSIQINVRLITATNKDLEKLVRDGAFREDLFYRINIISLSIPPLRERKGDIPDIAYSILKKMNFHLGRSITDFSPDVMQSLIDYSWPGNVRELMNIIESAMNFCRGSYLSKADFSSFFRIGKAPPQGGILEENPLRAKIESAEKDYLVTIMNQFGGKKKDVAEFLHVSKSTLYRMMKKLDLL
ncbi:MAG: sigma 54-interacting transcriptional regulator [Synergistaceae bacterium]|nr:sigma 54-interacting transcriptional regulator [Synergistaceae bacterium]